MMLARIEVQSDARHQGCSRNPIHELYPEMGDSRTCSVLGFSSLALRSKMKSYASYLIPALQTGVLLHVIE